MYPGTATVLDIGGQDTKAIQVDPAGIVESFQMNDRCAAGCGRYLGYIADEMNMGLHELGPLAMQSTKAIRINSTCTVFAGAELRDRLALGDKREDIMAGLHRHHPARHVHPGALGRHPQRVHLHRRRGQERGRGQGAQRARRRDYGKPTLNIDPGFHLYRCVGRRHLCVARGGGRGKTAGSPRLNAASRRTSP